MNTVRRRLAAPCFAIVACLAGASPSARAESAQATESAQVTEGARLFAEACARCHGPDGRGGAGHPSPIWGEDARIQRFEHARGLFEYNQMLMPFDNPATLDDDQKWAVVAYMLANHGVIARDDVLTPDTARDIPIR